MEKTGNTPTANKTKRGDWRQFFADQGLPHFGWECEGVTWLGDDEGPADEPQWSACKVCGTPIRFIHSMRHPEFPEIDLKVGCICSGHMEGDIDAAKLREKEAISSRKRRAHWVAKKWVKAEAGNWTKASKTHRATVYTEKCVWKWVVRRFDTALATWGDTGYSTADEAKWALLAYVREHAGPQAVDALVGGRRAPRKARTVVMDGCNENPGPDIEVMHVSPRRGIESFFE